MVPVQPWYFVQKCVIIMGKQFNYDEDENKDEAEVEIGWIRIDCMKQALIGLNRQEWAGMAECVWKCLEMPENVWNWLEMAGYLYSLLEVTGNGLK